VSRGQNPARPFIWLILPNVVDVRYSDPGSTVPVWNPEHHYGIHNSPTTVKVKFTLKQATKSQRRN